MIQVNAWKRIPPKLATISRVNGIFVWTEKNTGIRRILHGAHVSLAGTSRLPNYHSP